jgi:hypothetical protein
MDHHTPLPKKKRKKKKRKKRDNTFTDMVNALNKAEYRVQYHNLTITLTSGQSQ